MEQSAANTLRQGMDYEWTGLSYQEKLIGSQAYLIFALSITLVFLVLAAQYESWTDPAAVILTVPMALVGIVIALAVRRFPNDLYTQIGLVLMIALAAKNAILIVEFARELRAEGMSAADAAVEATRRRFRPILMTSIAFILGVVPLLTATGAGSASQQSLGTVVFGGMIASTLLAIPFVPVFYIMMQRVNERLGNRARSGKSKTFGSVIDTSIKRNYSRQACLEQGGRKNAKSGGLSFRPSPAQGKLREKSFVSSGRRALARHFAALDCSSTGNCAFAGDILVFGLRLCRAGVKIPGPLCDRHSR